MDPGAGPSAPNLSVGAVDAAEAEVPVSCSICFLRASQPVITSCGHLYCWPCLSSWLRRRANCPVCGLLVAGFPVIPIFTADRSGRRVHWNSGFLPAAMIVELGETTRTPAPLAPTTSRAGHTAAVKELHTGRVGAEAQALPGRVQAPSAGCGDAQGREVPGLML